MMKEIGIAAIVSLAVIAVVFRVEAIRGPVTGIK